jgi:hypothetical protein
MFDSAVVLSRRRPGERDLLFRELGIHRRPRATKMKAGIVITNTGADRG